MSVLSRLRRPRGRITLTALTAAALTLVPAAAASAHVHVIPDSTASGSFSVLTFRVPTESDTASTIKVQVDLPQDKPLLSVSVKPIPGWTSQVAEAALPAPVVVDGTTVTKAARTVTWTADSASAGIRPGQYQEFALSVGPLPAKGTVVQLPATQTYSDGTVVKWDEPTPASGTEPEHPTPAFTITASTGSDDGSAPASADTTGSTGTPAWVGITGFVLAVLGVLLGGAALLIARRRPRPATT